MARRSQRRHARSMDECQPSHPISERMKWLKDLPDDFTQEFRFTVSGVEDPQAWLYEYVKPGEWDWNESVTLTRDEIVGKEILKNSLLPSDLEGVVQMSMLVSHVLDGGVQTQACYTVANSIRYISFHGEQIESVPELSDLTGLIALNFSFCLSLTDLSSLAGISGLRFLRLHDCQSLRDYSVISELLGLEELNLSQRTLTDLPLLSALESLVSLNLSNCSSLTDISYLSNLRSLTSLNLSRCMRLSDLSSLSTLTGLETIVLTGNPSLVDLSILSGMTGLKLLSLGSCKSLTDISFLVKLKALTALNLNDCTSLEDAQVLSALPQLKVLRLSGCHLLQEFSFLSDLKGLTSLSLMKYSDLIDLSPLSTLTRIKELNLSRNQSLVDLTALTDMSELTSLNVLGCPLVDQPNNRRVLSQLPSLKKLGGISEPWSTAILWSAARRRGDDQTLHDMLPLVLDYCGNKQLPVQGLRTWLLRAIPNMRLSEDEWKSLDQPWWKSDEWSLLWQSMLNANRSLASSLLQNKLVLGEQITKAMEEVVKGRNEETSLAADLHGWLILLASGADWEESKEWLKSLVAWLPLSEVHSVGPDLLMALRVVGLRAQENEVVGRLTQAQGEHWVEQVEYRLASAAVREGDIGQAVRSIESLPHDMADELRSDLIVRWAKEMPEEVASWMSGFHTEATREQAAFRLASSDSSVSTLHARHLVLMDIVSSREAMLPFIESMAAGVPDDPWVKALIAEIKVGVGSLSQEVLEAMGLEMLFQDEVVRKEVGDRKLRKLIEARGQEAESVREQARSAALDLLRREDLID